MKSASKPFGGAISAYFNNDAPQDIRTRVKNSDKKTILDPSYPYTKRLGRSDYEETLKNLQIELVKMQSWVQQSGARIAVVFEGRDAAGKGGTIKRFREFLNPRSAKIVALAKPNEVERSQWYFQRYISHLPSAGEVVFFDRSWYNRSVIETVFGFCNETQRTQFFRQVPKFEQMLINDGIILIKLWLTVGRAEQLRRFLARESDALKQWKLSDIDVKGLKKWDEYTQAITTNFKQTHSDASPWKVILTEDKKRARIEAIQAVLSHIPYAQKNTTIVRAPDPNIVGGPAILE